MIMSSRCYGSTFVAICNTHMKSWSWCFEDALRVFYDEYCGNVVCWNAIISGAVKHNEDAVGLNLFREMCSGNPSPNKFTFPSVFGACAKREKLELGKGVHGLVVKYGEQEDLVVRTAIVEQEDLVHGLCVCLCF